MSLVLVNSCSALDQEEPDLANKFHKISPFNSFDIAGILFQNNKKKKYKLIVRPLQLLF